MAKIIRISIITAFASISSASSVSACYKHTFDKCTAPIQVSEAASSDQSPQTDNKPRSAASASGWVTTVTVNR